MKIAVLGAGAGGAAAASELFLAGHDVHLWARSPETLAPHQAAGGVEYEGVLGTGLAKMARITSDVAAAIEDVDAAVIALPTFSHAPMAATLARAGWSAGKPVILNPGHTGGALEFSHAFRSAGAAPPPVVAFSTLTYVARKYRPDGVTVSGRARQVRAAALGGGAAELDLAAHLFPGAAPVRDVLAADLSSTNLVLHPPGAVLGAAWVEATGGDFTFYVEGMTDGVARTMRRLDGERLAVAQAFGHALPDLIGEMQLVGTVEADFDDPGNYRAAIAGGEANRRIMAPDSFKHRYYREDFGHGLLPFIELARIAGVDVPVAEALYTLAETAVGVDYRQGGRTAQAMGIAGLSKDQLLEKVRAS